MMQWSTSPDSSLETCVCFFPPSFSPSLLTVSPPPPPTPQAEASMIKYGKLLLTELPDDTTQLLQNLCTDWLPRGQTPRPGTNWNGMETKWNVLIGSLSTEDVVPDWSDPALYIELFVNHRHHLTVFLEHQISTHVRPSPLSLFHCMHCTLQL